MAQNSEEKDYLLGTHGEELQRMWNQHCLWRDEMDSLWQRAGFAQCTSILDAGCGPGFATLELVRLLSKDTTVYAVDSSQRYVDHLMSKLNKEDIKNVKTMVGDIHNIDLPDNLVEGVYARWLFCWVPDAASAVKSTPPKLPKRPAHRNTMRAWAV